MGRLGSSMLAGMASTFACELAMKAILMTRNHEAQMTHDLSELYEALPEDSRIRLEGDFVGIAGASRDGQRYLGKGRYIEGDATKEALESLAKADQMRKPGKAAPVIADECLVSGLDYEIRVETGFEIDPNQAGMGYSQRIQLIREAGESAIHWLRALPSD